MIPQLPQNRLISTANRSLKPLDSRGFRSSIHFTGGAILQKERVNDGAISGDRKRNSTWHTGNWVAGDGTKRALATDVITKAGGDCRLRLAKTGRVRSYKTL